MAEEKKRIEVIEDEGPGKKFMPVILMEDLLDKLKLLNYDKEFHREFKFKSINKYYFAFQTNPGEQFYLFTILAAWLIRKCGKKFDNPQEYDDPNSTISNILDILRQMGVTIDFPPGKLKAGSGEQVIFVLDRLADQALKKMNFQWRRPIHPPEEEEEPVMKDSDDATVEEEEMIEEDIDYGDDDDDDDDGIILDLDGLRNLSLDKLKALESEKPDDVLESNTDTAEWKLEVERVLPQLKVTIRSDAKDWRSHIEQMHQHRKEIEESLSTTRMQLDKLYGEISRTLEKIGSREKYLNSQLEQLLLEYRAAQDQLAHVKEQYKTVSGGVTERSRILAQISDELEQVKQEMEERGSSMTDGTPLVNIRKALTRLKTEISQMDVRIGVASHTLLQAKLKEKGNLQRAANAASAMASFDVLF